MELKIFLTGDNHIGLKFNNYPDQIKEDLVNARIENLKNLVLTANKENCDLFVIAGDLFDKVKIAQRDVEKAARALKEFSGTVVVMPGNHDYYDDVIDLWKNFRNYIGENTIILNKWQPYSLKDNDIDAVIYPAFCHQKHSETNCLGWITDDVKTNDAKWNIGVAHGSLQGLSPDMENKYFNMNEKELEGLGMDVWLLGHTHIPYPPIENIKNRKVFNAGTPEPDGLDCRHGGHAWFISINENKDVHAKLLQTGQYSFYDIERKVECEHCLEDIKAEILNNDCSKSIYRINLYGRVERELLEQINKLRKELTEKVAYLDLREENLKLKITSDEIEREYTKDSFPYQILSQLKNEDEDALQLAYDLIRGCKDAN